MFGTGREYGGTITSQLKKIGSSCDWDRERFTMDEGCSNAVQTVFINLYKKGLIYKGSRIVNWCPVCKTSISDAEVEHEEQAGHFWHIKYPIVGEEGKFVQIATTRPETLLGDSALAVNPTDERYKDLVGKQVVLPLTDRTIPVIADEYVDKEFGTGVVKITPAHDLTISMSARDMTCQKSTYSTMMLLSTILAANMLAWIVMRLVRLWLRTLMT